MCRRNPAHGRGRIAIVTNAGRAAVDADGVGANGLAGRATVSRVVAHTTGAISVRQNRVVLAPGVCASSVAVMWRPDRVCASAIRKATGAIVHRSPGRSRHKPFQPPRREGRDVSGCPVTRYASKRTQFASGMAVHGSQPAPGLPCALSFEGETTKQNSGEMSREDAQLCLQFNCELEGGARNDDVEATACQAPTLVPRTQREAVRCRAGAHVRARCGVAPRAGHERIAFAQLS